VNELANTAARLKGNDLDKFIDSLVSKYPSNGRSYMNDPAENAWNTAKDAIKLEIETKVADFEKDLSKRKALKDLAKAAV